MPGPQRTGLDTPGLLHYGCFAVSNNPAIRELIRLTADRAVRLKRLAQLADDRGAPILEAEAATLERLVRDAEREAAAY